MRLTHNLSGRADAKFRQQVGFYSALFGLISCVMFCFYFWSHGEIFSPKSILEGFFFGFIGLSFFNKILRIGNALFLPSLILSPLCALAYLVGGLLSHNPHPLLAGPVSSAGSPFDIVASLFAFVWLFGWFIIDGLDFDYLPGGIPDI